MTAHQKAQIVCEEMGSTYLEERQRILDLESGVVLETESLVLLLFPFRASKFTLSKPVVPKEYKKPNAWFVWLMAGSITGVIEHMPYPLPLIIFARDKRIKGYTLEKLSKFLQPKYENFPSQR
jgi:hypothetical protein